MMKKNNYYVVVENSNHANWLSAEANMEGLRNCKKKAHILYRGCVVTTDIKAVVKQKQEGV
jgi:hypothetical protein